MADFKIDKISRIDLIVFMNTLTFAEAVKLNSVFEKSDKYNTNSVGKDILETKEELENFSAGTGKDLYAKLVNFYKNSMILDQLDTSLDTYNEKKYDAAIKSITADNILDMFKYGCDIGYGDKKTERRRSKDKIKEDLKYLRVILQELCKQKDIDCSALDKENFKYSNDFDSWDCDSDGLLDKYISLIHDETYMKEKIAPLLNACNSRKLGNAIETRYSTELKRSNNLEHSINGNTDNSKVTYKYKNLVLDTGNGKIDNQSIQLAGNCWVCAGLNSLVNTSEGKAFLEKNIKRDNARHITAVHLQGAEKVGLPEPKGDGVYTFTDDEIALGQVSLSLGDGDLAAFNLAVNQFRKESGTYAKEPGTQNLKGVYYIDYGSAAEIYEILTGLPINITGGGIGISVSPFDDAQYSDEYSTVYNVVKNGKGAVCLTDKDHIYSVVGTTDNGQLLIQESNQYPNHERNKRFEYIKDSNPPTYKCSEDKYSEIFYGGVTIFRWKK